MDMPQTPAILTADSALTTIHAGPVEQKKVDNDVQSVNLANSNLFDGASLVLQEAVSPPGGYATRSILFERHPLLPANLARAVESSHVAPTEIKENLSIKNYKAPKDLIRGRMLRHVGLWAGRVISASAVAFSIGLPAFIAAVTLTLLAPSPEPSRRLLDTEFSKLPREERDVLKSRALGLLDRLVRRSGSFVELPQVVLSNIFGRNNAIIAYMTGYGAVTFGEKLYIGDDYATKDDKALASTIAHELGHLYYPLNNRSSSFDNESDGKRRRVYLGLAGLGCVIAKISAVLIGSGVPSFFEVTAFGVRSFWWSGLLFCLGALALLAVRRMTLAIQRVSELQADHFAGWLTPSTWLAACLRSMQDGSTREDKGWRKYLGYHPPLAQRIRRLEAMVAPK
mgnify:FL=1